MEATLEIAQAEGRRVGHLAPLSRTVAELAGAALLTMAPIARRWRRAVLTWAAVQPAKPRRWVAGGALALAGGSLWYTHQRAARTPVSSALPSMTLARWVAGSALALAVGSLWYRRRRRAADAAPCSLEAVLTIGKPADEIEARWRDANVAHVALEPLATLLVGAAPSLQLQIAPGGRGTEATLRIDAAPQRARDATARLLVMRALRRFKSLVETGEVPTLGRQPSARSEHREELRP